MIDSERLETLAQSIQAALPGSVTGHEIARGELTLRAEAADIVKVARYLRDATQCQFSCIIDITAVDWPGREKRFDVVYHFLSPRLNQRIRVKIETDEATPVPSIIEVYRGADWYERETYDLYGVLFAGHPDLRRILTDYGFEGHRLRGGALGRRGEAREIRAGEARSGVSQFRFPLALGRHRLCSPGRREGEDWRQGGMTP